MEYQKFVEAMKSDMPISISPNNMRWFRDERSIKGMFKDFRVVMPFEEIGVAKKNEKMLTPYEVRELLDREFKALVVEEKNDHTFVISQKAYIQRCMEETEEGKIYDGVICSTCEWGAFFKINGDALVMVHINNLTRCKIHNLNRVFKVGYQCKIKVTRKEKTAEGIRLYGSRKAAYEEEKIDRDDIVDVKIGQRANLEGFFCELNPNATGIIDIPFKSQKIIHEGMTVQAIVKSKTNRGYRCKYLSVTESEEDESFLSQFI